MNSKQTEVKKWLESLASTVKILKNLHTVEIEGEEFNTCLVCQHGKENMPYVQLFSCLRRVADIMGFEIEEEDKGDCLHLSFKFEGVDFMEVEDK